MTKALHSDYLNVVVAEVINHEALDSKTFVLKCVDGKALPYFRAGQYISVQLMIDGSFTSRPYSLCSSPKDALKGQYAITVQNNPKGFVAKWILSNIKRGSKLVILPPHGNFFYKEYRDKKNIVALAGGSSITPFLSMAKAVKDKVDDYNLTILYGSRDEKNILLKEELDAISKACKRVKVVYVLSDEKKEGYENGFITAELVKKYAGKDYGIFICGPESMYRFLDKDLKKLGLPKRHIRKDMMPVTRDVASEKKYPVELKNKRFNITVHQGTKTYKIKASAKEPILVAIERAGIKAPSRCRSGVCGWCSSRVISGTYFTQVETDGRRWVEVLGGRIHPCASFPTSDMVIEVLKE